MTIYYTYMYHIYNKLSHIYLYVTIYYQFLGYRFSHNGPQSQEISKVSYFVYTLTGFISILMPECIHGLILFTYIDIHIYRCKYTYTIIHK